MDRILRTSGFAAFVGALICVSYPEVVFGFKAFVLRDYGIFGYPLAAYQREAFWQGEIPLWNPYNCTGLPFLAQWNTMVLYPGSLIYLLLPMPWGHGIFMFAHQFMAARGMYVLIKRWTGSEWGAAGAGVMFGFNGLILNSLMWPNNMAALAWMPWVVMAVDRAVTFADGGRGRLFWIGLGGLAVGCQMMTGAPELIGFTWILCLVALLSARPAEPLTVARFGVFAAIMVIGLGLSAAQLLPFIELLQQSQRSSGFGGAEWSMPLWGWANFLAPLFRFYRSPQGVYFQTGQEWTSSYYFGALALVLLPCWLLRRNRNWLWALLAVGSLWLAMGPAAKLWAALKAALPLLGFVRFPIKFVVPVLFAVAVLTGFALAEWEKGPNATTRKKIQIAGAVIALLICAIAFWSWKNPIAYEESRSVVLNAGLRLLLIGAAVYLLAGARSAVANHWMKGAFIGVLALDLLTHAPRQNTTAKSSVYADGTTRQGAIANLQHGAGRAFQTRAAHDRFYFEMRPDPTGDYTGRKLGLYGNGNLLDRVPTVDGFYSLYLPEQRAVWERLFLAPTNNAPAGIARLMGVRAISSPASPVEWVATRRPPLPFVSAGQRVEFPTSSNVISDLSSIDFDPAEVIYAAEGSLPRTEKVEAMIDGVQIETHRVRARITTALPSVMLLSQSWHPAWVAKVDGKATPIIRANHAFQAIAVPAGRRQIEFTYEDRQFKIGAFVSLATLVLCGILIWQGRKEGSVVR